MAPLEFLPADCLHLFFDQLISQFNDFLGLALASHSFLSAAKDSHVSNLVFDRVTNREGLSISIKYIAFYGNVAPFDSLIMQFPRHELTNWLTHHQAPSHAPFKARILVAADLLRRYHRLRPYEQGTVKKLLKAHKIIPGRVDCYAEHLWSPIRYTKILLLDGQMRKPLIEALGYRYLGDIYGPWIVISANLFFIAAMIYDTYNMLIALFLGMLITYIRI